MCECFEHADAERICAALNAGWQPIATAPKDGTPVLTWADGGVAVAEWLPLGDAGEWIPGGNVSGDGGYFYLVQEPTHWMPIPRPPDACAANPAPASILPGPPPAS